MGEGTVRESGMDMDTLLDLTRRTSKDLLDSTGDSAQCHVAAWMRGEFAGEGMHVYATLISFAVLKLHNLKLYNIVNWLCPKTE